MTFVSLAFGITFALVAIVYGGRVLLTAIVPKVQFNSESTLWRYTFTAGITAALAAWFLSLSLPAVLS